MLEFDNFMIRYTPAGSLDEKGSRFQISYYVMERRTPISAEKLASLMPMPSPEAELEAEAAKLGDLLVERKLLAPEDNYTINSKGMLFLKNEKGRLYLPFANTCFSEGKGYYYPEGTEKDENADIIEAFNAFKVILDKVNADIVEYLKTKA